MVVRILPIQIGLCALWLVAAGAGFVAILNYQNTSGPAGVTLQQWPSGAQITLDHNRDTLLMFAHPQCPCTRASLEELNRLLARSQGKAATQVLFFKPGKFPDDWTRTDLWRNAAAIPGVTVHEDLDGVQARLFGAETSGYVLLYDIHGQLLFQGGITGSRGHVGDNAGENAIVSLLNGQDANLKRTQVYGCSLLGKSEASPAGAAR
jgi:hypothetical protein